MAFFDTDYPKITRGLSQKLLKIRHFLNKLPEKGVFIKCYQAYLQSCHHRLLNILCKFEVLY